VFESDGIAAENEEERTAWASVGTSRELGPRTTALVNGRFSRVRFESPTPDRNDFDFGSADIGLEYELTPSMSASLLLLGDMYLSEEAPLSLFGFRIGSREERAISAGPGVEITYEATDRLRLTAEASARARWNSTDTTVALPGRPSTHDSIEDETVEYLGGIGLVRTFDRGAVALRVSRELAPSSLGVLRARNGVVFDASLELSEVSSLSLSAAMLFEEEETSLRSDRIVTVPERRAVSTQVSFARSLSPDTTIVASYVYQTEESGELGRIHGNGVFLSATHRMGKVR
jgi:hypothetical protein